MSEGAEGFPGPQSVVLGRKSWTAYVRPGIVGFVGIALASSAAPFGGGLSGTIRTTTMLYLIGRFLSLRSFRLYVDDRGVWVYQGIFPWSRGAYGVLWEHLDQAMYTRGLFAWLFRSYRVYVLQRFTQQSDIRVKGVHRGDRVVLAINDMHPLRAGRVENGRDMPYR